MLSWYKKNADLINSYANGTLVKCKEKLYVIGNTKFIEMYDELKDCWRAVGELGDTLLIDSCIQAVNEKIFIIGGIEKKTKKPTNSIQIFNTSTLKLEKYPRFIYESLIGPSSCSVEVYSQLI